jgi:hypothetical protein
LTQNPEEPGLVPQAAGMDFEKAVRVRSELGIDGLKVILPANFNHPAFSRHVLGLND